MATTIADVQTMDESQENLKLEITRVIKASRQRVFDAWTRPETIRLWFKPMTFTMVDASIDARVGGEYRFAMDKACGTDGRPDPDGNGMVTGRYVRVDPYDVLAFTWKNRWAVGEESLVTIELRDVEGGTEMKLTHERFLTADSRDRHFNGWSSVVPRLAEFFERA